MNEISLLRTSETITDYQVVDMARDLLRERNLWWSGSGGTGRGKEGREGVFPPTGARGGARTSSAEEWVSFCSFRMPWWLNVEIQDSFTARGRWEGAKAAEREESGPVLSPRRQRIKRNLYFFQPRDFIWGRTDGEFWNCFHIFSTPGGKSKKWYFPKTDESQWFVCHALLTLSYVNIYRAGKMLAHKQNEAFPVS